MVTSGASFESRDTAQGGQARGFGKPLVPANQSADFAVSGVVSLKTKIAGREVELLVIKRIIRDMHLAILAGNLAVSIDDYSRIVIDAGSTFLE